nr:SAP domain-containing protein [Candidatus Poseidoniaceae archaeon]
MSEVDYSSLKVAQLKELCNENSLPVSGRKADLVERLSAHSRSKDAILEAEESSKFIQLDDGVEFSSNSATFQRMFAEKAGPHTMKIIVAFGLSLLMISVVLIVQPAWLGFGHDLEFELIEFDESMARQYAQDLVDLGHPEWTGRMSGTDEEAAAAQMIEEHFKSLGMTTTLHSYEVEMHHVNAEPSVQVCTPGNINPFAPPCSVSDVGSVAYTFEHRIDY